MEISEKWFSKKIGCSIACNYRCCNSPSFHIEFEDDEIKYLSEKYKRNIKPIEYQNGRCKYLKENSQGCSFGDDKPNYCKKFPLTQNKNNKVVLSNWSWLHCPKDTDYELKDIVNGKYLYVLKQKHHNKRDMLILDDTIENTIPSFNERLQDQVINGEVLI